MLMLYFEQRRQQFNIIMENARMLHAFSSSEMRSMLRISMLPTKFLMTEKWVVGLTFWWCLENTTWPLTWPLPIGYHKP